MAAAAAQYTLILNEDSGKPGAPSEEACGPNDVLVGDRIEFDREYFVRPFVCRFEPQA